MHIRRPTSVFLESMVLLTQSVCSSTFSITPRYTRFISSVLTSSCNAITKRLESIAFGTAFSSLFKETNSSNFSSIPSKIGREFINYFTSVYIVDKRIFVNTYKTKCFQCFTSEQRHWVVFHYQQVQMNVSSWLLDVQLDYSPSQWYNSRNFPHSQTRFVGFRAKFCANFRGMIFSAASQSSWNLTFIALISLFCSSKISAALQISMHYSKFKALLK